MANARVHTKPRHDPEQTDELRLLEELEVGLKIDEDALDEALVQQPDLFYRVSRTLAILQSRRDALKQEVTTVEAQADLDIRKQHRKREDKITENEIKAEIRLDKTVAEVMNEFLELNNNTAQFQALKEAFQQRSYVLKDLVNLYIANYFGDNTGGNSANKLHNRDADSTRRAHREAHRGRA